MYSHYIAQTNGPITHYQYDMHQVGAHAVTRNRDPYVQGLAALRNAAGWIKEMRDTVIALANERAGQTTAEDEEETEDEEVEEAESEEVDESDYEEAES